MITFKKFLQESTYKSDITAEEAKKLFDEHCSDMDFNKPLWRGFRNDEVDAMLVQGELGGRKSANTTNHYTVILDKFLPPLGYPKRSGSIIVGNNQNREYTRGFGKRYAIFPYNNVPIGLAKHFDIWGLEVQLKTGQPRELDRFNIVLNRDGVSDESYKDLIGSIYDKIKSGENDYLLDIFGRTIPEINKTLRDAFTPPNLKVGLYTTANIHEYENQAECWIGGKCLAIKEDVWEEMAKDSK